MTFSADFVINFRNLHPARSATTQTVKNFRNVSDHQEKEEEEKP